MRASSSAFGFWNKSLAVAARTRAARIIPLRPMLVPPAATACHEWAGVPGTQQAVLKPAVGHDPGDVTHVGRPLADLTLAVYDAAEGFERKRLSRVSRILAAKAFSASS